MFGSQVYGTSVPESDTDYKEIVLPSADQILLQKAKKSINKSTKEDPNAKNTKDDVDNEIFTIHKYVELLMQGQTVALDMLFVPDEFIVKKDTRWWWSETHGEQRYCLWDEIRANKDKFLHSGVLSFVGYCRTQANKYGIKGSRMNTIKAVLDLLKAFNNSWPNERMENVDFDKILKLDHVQMINCKGPNGKFEPHLEVCNRKIGMRTKVEYAINVFQKIYDGYGHRAKLAANNEGIDWKALMHAVRVQAEAKELLTTGKITFPRPEKDLLLAIRKGQVPYEELAKIIEHGLDELETMESNLPEKPDYEYADDFLCKVYLDIINREKR